MVPVVRNAEARDPWSSAARSRAWPRPRAPARRTRDELSGSTITITSLGALGGIVTTPVINHPEVAIVGVNRIVERPVSRTAAWWRAS
jgi:2-oxoisovalerate dehydrogenase E2 component (dihydrolipoyl transacylase)